MQEMQAETEEGEMKVYKEEDPLEQAGVDANSEEPKPIENEEDLMIKRRFGFLPTSVWHLKKTASLMRYVNDEVGKGSYGSDDMPNLSQFNPDVAVRILKIWSKEGYEILDPFAGRCRAFIAQQMNRKYVGFEISPKVCAQLQANLSTNRLFPFKYTATIKNADSRTINYNEEFDMVFSCPPFWDVEDYNVAYKESIEGQLSDLHNYLAFLQSYAQIIANCFRALKKGGYCVWVVNDIRRDKRLIPFASDTINVFEKVGFKLHDVIINQLNSLAVMGVRSAIDNGYVPKMHEYILVFKKWE